jgi:hypothetical protein
MAEDAKRFSLPFVGAANVNLRDGFTSQIVVGTFLV